MRYQFHFKSGGCDLAGLELTSLAEASDFGIHAICGLLSDEIRRGELDVRGVVAIRDDEERLLSAVPFHEAIQMRGLRLSRDSVGNG